MQRNCKQNQVTDCTNPSVLVLQVSPCQDGSDRTGAATQISKYMDQGYCPGATTGLHIWSAAEPRGSSSCPQLLCASLTCSFVEEGHSATVVIATGSLLRPRLKLNTAALLAALRPRLVQIFQSQPLTYSVCFSTWESFIAFPEFITLAQCFSAEWYFSYLPPLGSLSSME